MNTTYTYIHRDKSLNRNQVFSCYSSSRGAENQTPGMWLERRETGPINPHVPYLAVTASNWPLVTALQQHQSSCNSAGERDGGQAISQNRCKMGRSNPSFSHLLLYSFPSKYADHAVEQSARGSFSQANAMGWYIVLMMIWVWVHKEKINFLSSTSLQIPDTRPASR